MADPTRILSLMMDFGFDTQQVRMLRIVMSENMKEVKDFLMCPIGSGYDIIGNIAEYSLVSEKALTAILDGIRSSMHVGVMTRIIYDERYGKCRISIDGAAKYSLDMTKLLHVEGAISFTIPDSVTTIGDGAFNRCSSLEEVRIPDSVAKIGNEAFSCCDNLEKVYIPDSVTKIGNAAFSYCPSLNEVQIPDSVIEIGDEAFANCIDLQQVHIPDSVTEIGDSAFFNCELVSFEVDERNKHYSSGSGALFDKNKELLIVGYSLVHEGKCTIPDSVMEIGTGAFSSCTYLEEVYIPDSVMKIGDYAFCDCDSLKNIHIPNSVTKIGDGEFSWCESLVNVHIPDSVTEIGDSAFFNCELVSFEVDERNKHYSSGSGALFDKNKELLIVGYSLVHEGKCTIPDSVIKIGDGALRYCSSLEEVYMPDSVKEIGSGAFESCSSLKELHIPESLTKIGDYAFLWCESLVKVNMPDSDREISTSAFDCCLSLEELNIP